MYWDWEFRFLNWIQDHMRSGFMDKFMSFITKFGDGGIFWIIVTLCLFIPKRTRKYAHVSALALIFCVVGGNLILKNVIARQRPFWINNFNPLARIAYTEKNGVLTYLKTHNVTTDSIEEGRTLIKLLVKAPNDYCFPSGHTQASFAAATSICMWNRKWGIPALILAAFVAFSRMYLYVHYPTDILGGVFFGLLYAFLALAICNKLFRNKDWDGCQGAIRAAHDAEKADRKKTAKVH